MTVVDKLKAYIRGELLNNRMEVEADDDLLGDGMIDSLGMTWLIVYIEEEFGVKVPPEDLVIEHFRSIEAIDEYLASKVS